MQIRESVIVSAVRTPTGKFLGALKDFTAPELGALVVREAVPRAGIDPALVDECIMGNVVQAGRRPEPGAPGGAQRRPARSRRGADDQQGLRLGTEGGDARRAGHRDRRHRHRRRRRHGVDEQLARTCCRACAKACAWATATVVDSMIHDGLWCAFENCHMGMSGEVRRRDVSTSAREEQDAYAAESHRKAAHATARGLVHGRDPAGRDPAEEGRRRSSSIATSRSAPTRPPRRSRR